MIGRVIDQSTEFGARVAAHLRDDVVVWLTSVSSGGAPLPTCVWFLWDGAESVRVQSLPTARRVEHLRGNDHVALNFPGNGQGGDIVVLSGRARIAEDAAPVDQVDEYIDKYRDHIARIGLTPEQFAQRYSVALDVRLTRVRGH
jgi:PPOX class probable F420-dependent enzyme